MVVLYVNYNMKNQKCSKEGCEKEATIIVNFDKKAYCDEHSGQNMKDIFSLIQRFV